jgi:hypothetical protein
MTSMARPRLFGEFPSGLASVSLRLQGGAHCRPPISRMGNKQGYAKIILATLGLHSGQGADGYWWAEADRDVAALLRIYADPVALLEVARIIRWWSDEEPRDLWERLRAERRARIAAGTDRSDPQREVAGWVIESGWLRGGRDGSYGGPGAKRGPKSHSATAGITIDGMVDRAQRLAEYAMIAASNRLICVSGPDLANTGAGGTTFGGEFADPPVRVAERMEETAQQGWPTVRVSLAIPSAIEVSAAIGTPGDLGGCIVYSDPPYINTTGYGHDLPRAAVVAMARDFAALGATVAISEQTPIEELDGWESVEITDGRVGQKRTFSAQKREYLTMNRTPGFTIAKQSNLFGVSE